MNMVEISTVTDLDHVATLCDAMDADMFPNWNSHPQYGNFSRALYGAINAESGAYQPADFVICDGDAAVLFATASSDGKTVSALGLPLVLAPHRELGKKRLKKVFAAAFGKLNDLGRETGAKSALICGGADGLTIADHACIDQLATPHCQINAVATVSDGPQAIHKNLRSSYRSLINWGREQLTMTHINATNPDRQAFDSYPAFHAEIAGGSKRPEAYWEVFWNEITSGQGELSLGYLADGSLASGTIVIDTGDTAYYTSGVYDRSKFEKPLGHFPLFDAMVRAGERGIQDFDIGEVFPTGSASEKEVQIGFFKKGFTTEFKLRTIWTYNLNSE